MATTTITGSVIDVQDAAQFDELTARESTLSISFFWADFHELCRPNGQIDVVVRQLATLHPRIRFLKIAAEELPELSERFQIAVVPTFVVAQGKSVLEKLEGANVAELAKRVDVLSKSIAKKAAADAASGSDAASASSAATATTASGIAEALEYRLKKLINASPVMLFMKGNPSDPKCGFSRQVVALLNEENIQYGTFDILNDEEVRQGLKQFSNWPTFPQLYVNGALIGGLDILKEMKSEGSIVEELGLKKNVEEGEAAFNESLRALVSSAPVLLFMKGTPQDPKCGFSKKTVKLLRDHQIAFSSFDILSDDQVRQGLKKFSNWPTYPQLYVKGKLVGGLDILNEMAEEGDLSEQLGVAKKEKRENKYEQLINKAPVMIFIKGSPQAPQCGFSRTLVDILNAEGFQYDHFDILSDDAVRQGLKKYSNWPTYPQLYVRGELIGGLDIVQQLQEEGELAALKE
ncbi:Grx4 family monothiol glutaredoxin [Globisporangium polare]